MNQRIEFKRQGSRKYPIRTDKKDKKHFKNENNLRDLWDNNKYNNIFIIGVPDGKDREQGIENIFQRIMTENFPKLVKEIHIHV